MLIRGAVGGQTQGMHFHTGLPAPSRMVPSVHCPVDTIIDCACPEHTPGVKAKSLVCWGPFLLGIRTVGMNEPKINRLKAVPWEESVIWGVI